MPSMILQFQAVKAYENYVASNGKPDSRAQVTSPGNHSVNPPSDDYLRL